MVTSRNKGQKLVYDGNDDEPRAYSSPPCYRHELDPGYLDAATPLQMDWPAVRKWRHEQRQRINTLRNEIAREARKRANLAILDFIDRDQVVDVVDTGIYWPMRGEFDSRPLMQRVLDGGGRVGIPVIVARDAPLEFWYWDRKTKMRPRGPWNLLAPAERHAMKPSVLFIPLVGFDADGHRLGNGGGYFDRTLAAFESRPVTIGVGYETGRLDTIHPQPHDIALDAIVTDKAITWHRRRSGRL